MTRTNPTIENAPCPIGRRAPNPAVLVVSVLLGALLVWLVARPLAPQVNGIVLIGRFTVFCISHGILFCVCEWISATRKTLLSPLTGPTAAAVTASMYLQVGGVPLEMVLLAVSCFLLGFHGFGCLRALGEERVLHVSKMLYSMSLATVLFSAAVLPVAVLNVLLTGGPTSSGFF